MLKQGGWQARQELNVQYVAYTRAEQTLIFLRDATPQPKPEGFSLRDALATTLWPEGQGGAGGQGAAAAGAASHAHPPAMPILATGTSGAPKARFMSTAAPTSSARRMTPQRSMPRRRWPRPAMCWGYPRRPPL